MVKGSMVVDDTSAVDKVTLVRAEARSFRFAVAGDIHLSSETPRSRRDAFSHAVLGKLTQIQNIAAKKDIQIIITTGDIFNTKTISNNFIVNLFFLLQQRRRSQLLFSIIGNHDLFFDKLSSISSTALGILYASKVINRLGIVTITHPGDPPKGEIFPPDSGDPQKGNDLSAPGSMIPNLTTPPEGVSSGQRKSQDLTGGRALGQPWLVIKGFDYTPNLRLDTSDLPASALKIAVVHAFMGEDKAFMPEQSSDWISREALAYSGFDWVIAGHDHVEDFFVLQNPDTGQNVHILIPGSVTRGTKHSFRRDQKPLLWTFEARSPEACPEGENPVILEKIPLDVVPADEVFSVEKIEREDVDKKIVDFVQTLQEVYTHRSGIYEVLDQLIEAGPVKTLVENYLTESGIFR